MEENVPTCGGRGRAEEGDLSIFQTHLTSIRIGLIDQTLTKFLVMFYEGYDITYLLVQTQKKCFLSKRKSGVQANAISTEECLF